MKRRHLNESQRAMVAGNIANMTRADAGAIGGSNGKFAFADKTSNAEAAAMMNVSERSVKSAKRVTP